MKKNGSAPGQSSELSLLLLTELRDGPLQAAELKKRLEQSHAFAVEPGSLYQALSSLERRGLIEPSHRTASQPSANYHLTEHGLAILRRYATLAFNHREQIKPVINRGLRGGIMKLATWVVQLYPRAWRERYEEEMLAVLDEHRITIFTLLDLAFGALETRLDPYYRTERLFAFKSVHAATLAFFAALAAFLFLVVGNSGLLTQALLVPFDSQPIAPSRVFLLTLPIYAVCWSAMLIITFTTVKQHLATSLRTRVLLLAGYLVASPVFTLLLCPALFALHPVANMPVATGVAYVVWLFSGVLALISTLLLTIFACRQATITRKKRIWFFVILIDALLIGNALPELLSPSFGFWPRLVYLIIRLFQFALLTSFLLALIGNEKLAPSRRVLLVAADLTLVFMSVYLLLFLIGDVVLWTQHMSLWTEGTLLDLLPSGTLPMGFAGIGLFLSTLFAGAALHFMHLHFHKASASRQVVQELPPLEMRQ
jgi:DNA-binding PadR family transcriptional regulator